MTVLRYSAAILVTTILILFATFIGAVTFFLWQNPPCGEDLIHQSPSSGDYVANVYVRGCGATTGFVTHINIADKSEVIKPDFNGIITEGEILAIPDKVNVVLSWKSPTELEISILGYQTTKFNYARSLGAVRINMK